MRKSAAGSPGNKKKRPVFLSLTGPETGKTQKRMNFGMRAERGCRKNAEVPMPGTENGEYEAEQAAGIMEI